MKNMKTILALITIFLVFSGCSSQAEEERPERYIGQNSLQKDFPGIPYDFTVRSRQAGMVGENFDVNNIRMEPFETRTRINLRSGSFHIFGEGLDVHQTLVRYDKYETHNNGLSYFVALTTDAGWNIAFEVGEDKIFRNDIYTLILGTNDGYIVKKGTVIPHNF